ncbi:MAG: hypothetical protein QNK37_31625 [Acidobacteriota bacterium]|nr:hypothetical protein [Acidobacteriota bacterium]
MRYLKILVLFVSITFGFAEDPGWPREYLVGKDKVLLYQPQIDSWDNHELMRARLAVSVTPEGEDTPVFGVAEITAETETDMQARNVLFENLKPLAVRFPNVPEDKARPLIRTVTTVIANHKPAIISLDRILAYMELDKQQHRSIEVNLDPPPIFYSDKDAVLVIFMGDPVLKPVEGTNLLYAANTNWDVFFEVGTGAYYLLNESAWFTTDDVSKSLWKPVSRLPSDFNRLPGDDNWAEVKKQVPGKRAGNDLLVFTSKEPAELILTDGAPAFKPILGTGLMEISNTDGDLFLHGKEGNYYYLVAGRWFRAGKLTGPWSAATRDLPADFEAIPEDHPRAHVLASVPGSQAAEDAVLLASVPKKATVNIEEVSLTVVYEGSPKFVRVKGAEVAYAVNTPYDVFLVDGRYYCCNQGIWFIAETATGDWRVCTKVPKAIYNIPPEHPKHNVTYVYVYDSTPTTVVVGHTSGYTGQYIAAGILMFGVGLWIADEIHDHWHHHHYHYHYHPHFYSYGCGARYNYYYGGYYRSARVYGPYGGAGRAASYDPRTGTYRRGAYAYGPRGSARARQAYNPYTGRYAAGARADTIYGSWGRGVVSNGRDWARAGYRSDYRGTVAGAQTSRGGAVVAGSGRRGSGYVARDRHGNIYAGRDGHVYRGDKDQWQRYDGKSWSKADADNRATRSKTTRSTASRSTATRTTSEDRNRIRRDLERQRSARERGNAKTERWKSRGQSKGQPNRKPVKRRN